MSSPFNLTLDRTAVLGRGTYGVVFRGTFINAAGEDGTHNIVAVKRIQLVDVDNSLDQREQDIMKDLNHLNVLKIFSFTTDDDFM